MLSWTISFPDVILIHICFLAAREKHIHICFLIVNAKHIHVCFLAAHGKIHTIRSGKMKFVVQRVTSASCTVDQNITGSIETGFLVLIGVSDTDTTEIADKMTRKLINLRIFEDSEGKTNRSLKDVSGGLLLISQFTLYADCRKGNRPSFIRAGNPVLAEKLYEYIIKSCKKEIPVVEQGIFGADMKLSLVNDGPFTVILDSDEIC